MSESTHTAHSMAGIGHQPHLADGFVAPASVPPSAHPGVALHSADAVAGIPLLSLTIEDGQGHQAGVQLTAPQVSILLQEAMAHYLAMRWQSSREAWLDIRPPGATKWHLSLCQHAAQGHLPLCRHVSTRHPDRRSWEVREAGVSLWDGHLCHSCTWLWMEQATPPLSLNALLPFLAPST